MFHFTCLDLSPACQNSDMQQAVAAGLGLSQSIQINDRHHRPNTSLPGQLENPGPFTQGLYHNY